MWRLLNFDIPMLWYMCLHGLVFVFTKSTMPYFQRLHESCQFMQIIRWNFHKNNYKVTTKFAKYFCHEAIPMLMLLNKKTSTNPIVLYKVRSFWTFIHLWYSFLCIGSHCIFHPFVSPFVYVFMHVSNIFLRGMLHHIMRPVWQLFVNCFAKLPLGSFTCGR